MRVFAGTLVALVFAAAAIASSGARIVSATATSPHFRAAPGWVVASRGPTQPWISSSMAVAVTAPDIAAVRPFAAFTSLKRLRSGGILVWAMTIGRNRPTFTPMQWPPRLSSFRVDHGWEGQPAANVEQRLQWGVVDGWDMDVRVFFATQHPGAQLLRKAQQQLDRLVLPSS